MSMSQECKDGVSEGQWRAMRAPRLLPQAPARPAPLPRPGAFPEASGKLPGGDWQLRCAGCRRTGLEGGLGKQWMAGELRREQWCNSG